MRVNRLTKLIRSDDRFFIKDHHLHDAKIVIDANNLAIALLERIVYRDRTDRVGVNLVAYGKQVELLFDNLRKCGIEPILAFDGAQTINYITPIISRNTKRIEEYIKNIEKLNQSALHISRPGLVADSTRMVLKSIALEKQVKVVQCFSEGKKYIAKTADDCDSPVLSDDEDFLILEVKRGVIPIGSLKFEDVKWTNAYRYSRQHYMDCDLFDQSHFVEAFPGLDKSCLPLLGSIAGNKVSEGMLDFLLLLIPRNLASPKRDRLKLLLEFLCNKSLKQNIDSLVALVEAERREEIKALIKNSISYYKLSEEDDLDKAISKHYKEAFCKTYSDKFCNDPVKANDVAEKEMQRLSHWLKKKIETTNLTKTSLEYALRKIILLRPEMDNFKKPIVHKCVNRCRSVMLALMRSSHTDNLPFSFYHRERDSIKMIKLEPIRKLENYGSIDYLIYDVCEDLSDDIVTTKLTQSEKTAILLATFHSSIEEFSDSITRYDGLLQPQDAEEFVALQILFDYIRHKSADIHPHFCHSVRMTYLYYLHYGDLRGKSDDLNESCLSFHEDFEQFTSVNHLQDIDQRTIAELDIAIVRNIVDMQTVIRAYEELNAFLGTSLPTLRMHKWFNSCYIYNFATRVEPMLS